MAKENNCQARDSISIYQNGSKIKTFLDKQNWENLYGETDRINRKLYDARFCPSVSVIILKQDYYKIRRIVRYHYKVA